MKTLFFKVVRPMNKDLRLLLCSFMRSWIISTIQSGECFTLGVVGTVEIYSCFWSFGRTGRNMICSLIGLFKKSVFLPLGSYLNPKGIPFLCVFA